MIPKIERFLYATDLSKNSAYAFRYAVNSAENHDAQIHILHVLERIPPSAEALARNFVGGEKLERLYEAGRTEVLEKIRKRLEEFCQKEFRDRPDCSNRVASIQVVEGDPAGIILEKAEELKVDTVIMGTHGKGFLAHAFLGSVAEKVLQRTKIPVFIVPIPEEKDFVARKIEKPKDILDVFGLA